MPHVGHGPRKQVVGIGPVDPIVVRNLPGAIAVVEPRLVPPLWVVLDAVWRVGHHHERPLAAKELGHVLCVRAVAAEQAVVAKNDQVANLRHRIIGKLWGLVLDSLRRESLHDLAKILLVERERVPRSLVHAVEKRRQRLVVPFRQFPSSVVGDGELDGGRAVVVDDNGRYLLPSERLRCCERAVSGPDDHAVALHDDGLALPEHRQRRLDGLDILLPVPSSVGRVWVQQVD